MNENEIMKIIKEQTKDLQIPDGISPEAMKKMLDEKGNTSSSTNTTNNRKFSWIHYASMAACFVLIVSGSLFLKNQMDSNTVISTNEKADFAKPDSQTNHDTIQESAATETKNEEQTEINQALFKNPDSYEEYFKVAKKSMEEILMEEDIYKGASTSRDVADKQFFVSEESMKSDAVADNAVNDMSAKKTDYSQTNLQEKGIDEGDIIKTDGQYIYRITTAYNELTGNDDYHLTITKTAQGKMEQTASIHLDELLNNPDNYYLDFHEFYIQDNTLILMYNVYDYSSYKDETFCYISIFDIKDKQHPKKIKTLSQSGYYDSSRISEGYLYTISNYECYSFENDRCYEDYIPMINEQTLPCYKIYYNEDFCMSSSHVVTSIDLSNPDSFVDSISVPVKNGNLYVSDTAIYFYATLYERNTKTEILKMYHKNGILSPGASTSINGYLYGPFAINEYQDHLRIVATVPNNNRWFKKTNRWDRDNELSNSLYILDKNLELTGSIRGIARDEIIYSARFMGDIGYFVTYKNTDPLFSVDLSNPNKPKIIGSLKIPGFSNYLHPYSEHMLFGFGEERDPDTQEFLGLKLSMFDTSDPANVTENDKQVIRHAWGSNALSEYKDMMIDPEKNIIGFSYHNLDPYGNESMYFATYSYDKEYGFVETASYRFDYYFDYDVTRLRGLFIGDYLYLSAGNQITSYRLHSEEPVATLELD